MGTTDPAAPRPVVVVGAAPPPPPAAAVEPLVERRRPRGCGCLLTLLLLLLALPLGALAAGLLLAPVRQSVLVLGTDARPDELRRGDVGRTDTLLLLVADRAQPQVAMISVPRDLWVPIPGHGEERVNAAYAMGGPDAARGAVGGVLGVSVDRYAVIGLQGVRDVVDALGGVEITVEQAIHDPTYPTDDYGTIEITIPAGRQRMDGETALRYARTRYQDSDFGRIARQQRVLAAVRTAAVNPASWPRLPAVLAAAQRSVRTNLDLVDLVGLATAFVRAGEPERLVLDTSLVEPVVGQGGASLLAPRQPALRQAVARLLGDQPATVEVLNGASVAGLARTTADRLAQRGISVARVGDAERPQAQTTVLARAGMRGQAEAVAGALGLPAGRVSDGADLPPGVDVRVVLGADLAR